MLAQQIVKLILSSCQRNPPLEEIEEFQSDSSKSGQLVQPPDWQYYGSIFLLDNLENNFLWIHRWKKWRGWICKSVGFQPVTIQSTSMRGSWDFQPETKTHSFLKYLNMNSMIYQYTNQICLFDISIFCPIHVLFS